ncbi:unnamed protein product [Camellia sinensis]
MKQSFPQEAVVFMGLSSFMIPGLLVLFISKVHSVARNSRHPESRHHWFRTNKGRFTFLPSPCRLVRPFLGKNRLPLQPVGSRVLLHRRLNSGHVECHGAAATPPATLAEFTLGSGTQDFYDVSLVDWFNLPMIVDSNGGSGPCRSTGCAADLIRQCPNELQVGNGDACKSACGAFGSPQYCCYGAYSSPSTCPPSMYSQMFKSACPKSYSYAYDDATSTFTCSGADYTVTFCPSISSQKSSDNAPALGSESESTTATATLANLATGGSTRKHPSCGGLVTQLALSLLLLFLCHSHSYNCSLSVTFHED